MSQENFRLPTVYTNQCSYKLFNNFSLKYQPHFEVKETYPFEKSCSLEGTIWGGVIVKGRGFSHLPKLDVLVLKGIHRGMCLLCLNKSFWFAVLQGGTTSMYIHVKWRMCLWYSLFLLLTISNGILINVAARYF